MLRHCLLGEPPVARVRDEGARLLLTSGLAASHTQTSQLSAAGLGPPFSLLGVVQPDIQELADTCSLRRKFSNGACGGDSNFPLFL